MFFFENYTNAQIQYSIFEIEIKCLILSILTVETGIDNSRKQAVVIAVMNCQHTENYLQINVPLNRPFVGFLLIFS